jgi:outer membrane immunogenic protein
MRGVTGNVTGVSRMKKLFALAAVLAMSAPLTAFAADLPQPPPPMPRAPAFVPPPPFTWSGVYGGINGGYAWGNVSDGLGDSFNSNGGIVGGTFGFNYQWGWFVAGFEGDIDWSGQKNSASASAALLGGGGVAATATYKNDVLSTFAARFGVAADHWLFYGKAGGAWTEEKFSANGSVVVPGVGTGLASESDSFSRLGWMAGAGVEYAITNNLTAKVEYNYIDFGSTNETLNVTATAVGVGAATFPVPITSKLHDNVVKVGLNWLFNGT